MFKSRVPRAVVLTVITALLIAALWWAYSGIVQLNQLRLQTLRLGADLAAAKIQSAQLQQLDVWASQRLDIKKRAATFGLVESQWGSRVIQQPSTLVMRDQAESLVQQLTSKAGENWFAPEIFEVAVVAPTEGLFTPPTTADRGLNVQVKGTFYFKTVNK